MQFSRSDMSRSLAKAVAACLAIACVALPGGCASSRASPSAAGAATLTELGPATEATVRGQDLRAALPGRTVFGVWDGRGDDRLVIERATSRTGEDAEYIQRRFRVDSTGETLDREQRLRVRQDGAVVLVEEVNHGEGVEVVFEPPLVVLPARVEPGAMTNSTGQMTVHPLGNRARVRAKGSVNERTTCLGAVRVVTPRGSFVAWKIQSTLDADLGASRVSNTTELWLVPEVGIIAERRREKTTVLGLAIRNNTEAWVIVEPAPTSGPE